VPPCREVLGREGGYDLRRPSSSSEQVTSKPPNFKDARELVVLKLQPDYKAGFAFRDVAVATSEAY
jgi:hypothetical protein